MQFYIMTLFPDMVMDGLNTSIIGRAMDKGLLDIEAVNIRDYAFNKHNSVDDYPHSTDTLALPASAYLLPHHKDNHLRCCVC